MVAAAADEVVFSLLPVAVMVAVGVGLAVAFLGAAWARREGQARGSGPPVVPVPAPEPDVGGAWTAARERFDAISRAYAAFECDPARVALRPALADVEVPSTARFVDAYAEALALRTDVAPPAALATRFVAAARTATVAWTVAVETADRIAHSHLPPRERAVLARVVKVLVLARESDSEPERRAAYIRARADLERLDAAGIVRLPHAARVALEAGARRELTA